VDLYTVNVGNGIAEERPPFLRVAPLWVGTEERPIVLVPCLIESLLITVWNYQDMREAIKLTLGDGSIVEGRTLEEAIENAAALKKQHAATPRLESQVIDSTRARKLPTFDTAGNRIG